MSSSRSELADQGDGDPKGAEFSRPWEADAADEAGPGDDSPADDEAPAVDWEAMTEGGGAVGLTPEDYAAATTHEYRGLAEDVSKAAEKDWKWQAVAAEVPGVESGLVGLGDVSGGESLSEEDFEAVEQAAVSDLTVRVASALVIFGMFLGSLLLGGWWFTGLVILVMVVAGGEFYANVRARGYQPLALFGLLGLILVGVGAHNWGIPAIAGWVAAVSLVTILFFSLTQRRRPLENASLTILGIAWVSMLAFAISVARGPHPVAYVLFVVLLVGLCDIGAYFVGHTFGKRKLAPVVSPKKTVEGLVGGLVVAAVAAAILTTFPAWETISLVRGLAAAAVVGIVSPFGDLAESMVKRSIGVKDMGSVLPGHGGMLDRIDGFLFVVPAVYFLFRAFGLL